MGRPTAKRTELAELVMKEASRFGIEKVSLRGIANRAECSTAVIFQNFDNKSQLMAAAIDVAHQVDARHHCKLRSEMDGLITSHLAFADILSAYIAARPAMPQASFLSECVIKLGHDASVAPILRQWHMDRRDFWRSVLSGFQFADRLSQIVNEYCLMEEYYAFSLHHHPRYRLLLSEASRALTDASFHDGAGGGHSNRINRLLEWKAFRKRRHVDDTNGKMAEEMLEHAVELIISDGVSSLNQRRLAQLAGVSSSMIAYHFKDMKTFTNEAIWRALVRELPREFDPERIVDLPRTAPDWVEFLHQNLLSARADGEPGFYVSYTRMTAEAALLARHDSSLAPLMLYLREIDGWGTYRLSRNIPIVARNMKHEHATAFALWVKAEALLHHAGLVDPDDSRARLDNAISLIFPTRS